MRQFITLVIVINLLGCVNVNESKKDQNAENVYQTFNDAKQIITGNWISTESILSDIIQYDILIFNPNQSVKFAQGSSENQALRLAKESTLKGEWHVIENSENLISLNSEQRFLIQIDIEGVGVEILRVEIDNANNHRMGRVKNSKDEYRDNVGLYSFGGKIFYKK